MKVALSILPSASLISNHKIDEMIRKKWFGATARKEQPNRESQEAERCLMSS